MSEKKKVFKIFFKGFQDRQDKGLNLIFISPFLEQPVIPRFSDFIRKYNEYSRKKRTKSMENIKKIIGYKNFNQTNFSQFLVILFTQKQGQENNKKGYFIGKNNEGKYILLGLWPFTEIKNDYPKIRDVRAKLSDLIANIDNYQNIVLIT